MFDRFPDGETIQMSEKEPLIATEVKIQEFEKPVEILQIRMKKFFAIALYARVDWKSSQLP